MVYIKCFIGKCSLYGLEILQWFCVKIYLTYYNRHWKRAREWDRFYFVCVIFSVVDSLITIIFVEKWLKVYRFGTERNEKEMEETPDRGITTHLVVCLEWKITFAFIHIVEEPSNVIAVCICFCVYKMKLLLFLFCTLIF